MSNALALRFFRFSFGVTVECVIHQQGHFVIGFYLLLQCFECGFFFCLDAKALFFSSFLCRDALLFRFPFCQRSAHFIFQQVETLTNQSAALVNLLRKGFKLCNKVFTGIVDIRLGASHLVRH